MSPGHSIIYEASSACGPVFPCGAPEGEVEAEVGVKGDWAGKKPRAKEFSDGTTAYMKDLEVMQCLEHV